jgi:hypothetical protein
MLTLFHVLPLLGAFAGLAIGIGEGGRLFGMVGAVGGAIIGCYFGFVAGRLPFALGLWAVRRQLAAKSVVELRADLRDPNCFIANVVLLELHRRGEDIRPELSVVLDMLVSEDFGRRGQGWAALSSAFPDMAVSITDYRINDSVVECRRKTEFLRAAAKTDAADG